MIELCPEYLPVRCIWLYVIIMSHTRFRVNLHSIVTWIPRNSCSKQAQYLQFKWQQRDSKPVPSKQFLDIQVTTECRFTLKRVHDMLITYSQMQRTDKHSQHSSIIWSVWLNGWVFIYKQSGFGFESCCCHLNFRDCACFEQGVPWLSGNHIV